MDKKGQGISMTYIIIAALALVVLVVIILFFTGALGTLTKQQGDVVVGATDQQKDIWRGQCKLYCSLGQEENFKKHAFEVRDDDGKVVETWACTDGVKGATSLEVDCPDFK